MIYDPTKIPATLEEFYTSGWANFVKLKISRYNLKDINNSVEDIFQDMMIQMSKYRYIETYDPNGRPFEVYLTVFVFNFMSKRYKKEYGSKYGQLIVSAKGLEEGLPDDLKDSGAKSVEYLERLEDESACFADYTALVESIKSDLSHFVAKSSVIHDGVKYDRDPLTVFKLLMEGDSVKEISEKFETSKQFIYLLLEKIRGCDSLKEYHFAKAK